MINKKIVQWNAILFAVFGGLSLVFGLTGVGAMAIIFGVINLSMALFFLVAKEHDKAMACLIMGGVYLLVGFGLCSQFAFNV